MINKTSPVMGFSPNTEQKAIFSANKTLLCSIVEKQIDTSTVCLNMMFSCLLSGEKSSGWGRVVNRILQKVALNKLHVSCGIIDTIEELRLDISLH